MGSRLGPSALGLGLGLSPLGLGVSALGLGLVNVQCGELTLTISFRRTRQEK